MGSCMSCISRKSSHDGQNHHHSVTYYAPNSIVAAPTRNEPVHGHKTEPISIHIGIQFIGVDSPVLPPKISVSDLPRTRTMH